MSKSVKLEDAIVLNDLINEIKLKGFNGGFKGLGDNDIIKYKLDDEDLVTEAVACCIDLWANNIDDNPISEVKVELTASGIFIVNIYYIWFDYACEITKDITKVKKFIMDHLN